MNHPLTTAIRAGKFWWRLETADVSGA
jgi:hypothetical protein